MRKLSSASHLSTKGGRLRFSSRNAIAIAMAGISMLSAAAASPSGSRLPGSISYFDKSAMQTPADSAAKIVPAREPEDSDIRLRSTEEELEYDNSVECELEDENPEERELEELTVSAVGPRRLINRRDADGGLLSIDGALLAEQPSFMGGRDPMALVKTLPSVATNNDLSAGLHVRGASNGSNTFLTDDARIFNPMHMLGLYSAFNPAFYNTYNFRAGRIPAIAPNTTAALFQAISNESGPTSELDGEATVGLIESHIGIAIPLKRGVSSLKIGGRTTYLSTIFPNLLQLGESRLKYGFTDANLRFDWQPASTDRFSAGIFFDTDRIKLENTINATHDGDFGWKNLAADLSWTHGSWHTFAAASLYSNSFYLSEGGRTLNLPSSAEQYTLSTSSPLPLGFDFQADINYRSYSGQGNRGEAPHDEFPRYGASKAFEANAATQWSHRWLDRFTLSAGLRLTLYSTFNYTRLLPQPRLSAAWHACPAVTIYATASRLSRTDMLLAESSTGLPADFFINASRKNPAERVLALEGGLTGRIPVVGIDYTLEGYWNKRRNAAEFDGNILQLLNSAYDPTDDLICANGYAAGISLMLMRQWGRLRGRVAYTFGVSKLRSERWDNEWVNASDSRLHDLNAMLTFDILSGLSVSASYTHATGLPYTEARYAYMIGENLICDYYPHNSSRLPAYNRLDLSADWVFYRRKGIKQSVNLSVYNALASHNVLMMFTIYNASSGLERRQSVMKTVIPSISYAIEF